MKKLLLLLLCSPFCVIAQPGAETTEPQPGFGTESPVRTEIEADNDGDADSDHVLGALLSFNFTGNNKGASNLTPMINYGWEKKLIDLGYRKGKDTDRIIIGRWDLSVNPYTSGQIDIEDSASFITALMLPGIGGLRINSKFVFGIGKDFEIVFAPINFGYKFIANFADSNRTIAQHNLRTALAFTITERLILGFQYTHGWHNSTSASEKLFKEVFSTSVSDLGYIMLSLQTKLTNIREGMPAYLFVEWRSVTNPDFYKSFDNKRILTIGMRSDLNIDNAMPARRARRDQR